MSSINSSNNENNINIYEWDKQDVIRFHKQYECNFAGDALSSEIYRLSKKFIKGKVLDIGAGSGALINKIPGAIGIDLVPKHPKVIKADIANLPFEDSTFDIIFATEVLEHLDNKTLQEGIGEIRRVLKNQGRIIVTVPYKENLEQNMVFCPKCGKKFHRCGHIQVFDEHRIKDILESNGFKLIKLKILPLGFKVYHPYLNYFIINLLNKFKVIHPQYTLFVIATKI
jgi:SAM-dependent methyltransferase